MASENNKLERFKHHWQNMPVHQQFETAVGIIKNLPRDGKLSILTEGALAWVPGVPWHP